MKRFFSLLFACLLLFVSSAHASASFMHTDGTRVLDANGDLLVLRSISISSEQTPENEVYRDIASLGFHSVRLHFNYDQLETDANPYQYLEAGLTWLDSHLAFAQKNGIGVILNLHVPQGGFQSWGKGDALWTDPENASRLTALWVMLATRYRDNPTVLGYSLLNEPCPVAIEQQAAYATWQTLATSVCSAVRAVDPNHTLVVEPVGMWTE
ncbi:MAG: cellulase family glycosylhydrolase, partial [Clostridia bacterium]